MIRCALENAASVAKTFLTSDVSAVVHPSASFDAQACTCPSTLRVAFHLSLQLPDRIVLLGCLNPPSWLCRLQVVVTQIPEPETAGAGAGDMMGGY